MGTFSTVVSLCNQKIFAFKTFALIAIKHRWKPGLIGLNQWNVIFEWLWEECIPF